MTEEKTDGAAIVETAGDGDTVAAMAMPPSPDKVIAEIAQTNELMRKVVSIEDFPPYVAEEENPDILVRGRWLERGGSAWIISTAGTGKSIASVQMSYKWAAGRPFAGLHPHRPMTVWIVQSEDSPSRITIDREDIVAELNEREPDVDWRKIGAERVRFAKIVGRVGTEFIDELDGLLTAASMTDSDMHMMPDVVIINPFMAFVGGPVTDGGYVTPFLRGGDIAGRHTDGLQTLLERHNVAAVIFHHTPKPPKDTEVDSWLKSMFPEYQGAGSSDITNWGRSFITMMRCKGHPKVVCMVAGKNGGEIGWEEIGGSRRHYMAWSDTVGITGRGNRHAWRELTQEEYEEIAGAERRLSRENGQEAARKIARRIIEAPVKRSNLEGMFTGKMNRALVRMGCAEIYSCPQQYGVFMLKGVQVGRAVFDVLAANRNTAEEFVTKLRREHDDEKTRESALGGKGSVNLRKSRVEMLGNPGEEDDDDGQGVELLF